MTTSLKRLKLIELSKVARELQENEFQDMTINKILVNELYTNADNTEFNTFHQWKGKGMNIKKGSNAFLVWGKKRNAKEAAPQEATSEEEKEFEFFPMCYLFSNAQVEPQSND